MGKAVGDTVGAVVGPAVGGVVGKAVGLLVGVLLGPAVGRVVGAAVGVSWTGILKVGVDVGHLVGGLQSADFVVGIAVAPVKMLA